MPKPHSSVCVSILFHSILLMPIGEQPHNKWGSRGCHFSRSRILFPLKKKKVFQTFSFARSWSRSSSRNESKFVSLLTLVPFSLALLILFSGIVRAHAHHRLTRLCVYIYIFMYDAMHILFISQLPFTTLISSLFIFLLAGVGIIFLSFSRVFFFFLYSLFAHLSLVNCSKSSFTRQTPQTKIPAWTI